MIERTIEIDGIPVRFRASGALPRLYRLRFGRDLMRDLARLQKALAAIPDDADDLMRAIGFLEGSSLETVEDLAYMMARHADPSVPDDPGDWLGRFETFSLYAKLPEILSLWASNLQTVCDGKKK